MAFWVAAAAVAAASYVATTIWLSQGSNSIHWVWDDGSDNVSRKRIQIDVDDVSFPERFLWGTATAAYQVEGGIMGSNWAWWETQKKADGTPRIKRGQKCGNACEHWARFEEDVKLMKKLGVNSYRFSIEWSRVQPSAGVFEQSVLDRYAHFVDVLIANGIEPVVTLHHFSEPLWFFNSGGFEKAENIPHFVTFAEIVFRRLSDKVKMWCTFNEPEVFVSQGWFLDGFPPGKKNPALAATVLLNILNAHVETYARLKALRNGANAKIGIVKNIFQFDPYHVWNPLDKFFANLLDAVMNASILDFFRTGEFKFWLPTQASLTGSNPRAPKSNDFVGLNYYSHYRVKTDLSNLAQPFELLQYPCDTMTDMAYPIYPEGLHRAIMEVAKLNLPIYVTENGIADAADDRRALFIRRYLYAVSKAIKDGADVRGYFYWSLMDNFEWGEGYDMKFGLFEVDFETQERTLRDGAKAFVRIVAKARGLK